MALEDIFRALEEQAESECEAIVASARAQAEAIAEEAAEQAKSICATCVDTLGAAARTKATRRINEAKLEAKKRVAAIKEAAVADVFESAERKLESIRETDGYATLFRSLLDEALGGDRSSSTVLVDVRDLDLAKRALVELGVEAEVKPEITTSGGVVVERAEGRILRKNTFEERLERVRQSVRAEVAEILFK